MLSVEACRPRSSFLSSLPMASKSSKGRKLSITLKDVVVHLQHMERRLTKRIDDVDEKLTNRIDGVEGKLIGLEERVTRRMDALEEDLTATIKDTIKIRQHVGMAVSEDA